MDENIQELVVIGLELVIDDLEDMLKSKLLVEQNLAESIRRLSGVVTIVKLCEPTNNVREHDLADYHERVEHERKPKAKSESITS